jgi:SlyX protein
MEQPARSTQTRIDELEARLAQQDQAILELSDEIYRQQREIAQLEAKVRDLSERLGTIAAREPDADPANEVPPHY